MSTTQAAQQGGGVDILHLAERRMSWLQGRQSVLAGNVANANTPRYRPKDVAPFQGVVNNAHVLALRRTEPGHMLGPAGETHVRRQGRRASLDGNRVVLEDELARIADTSDQQRFATSAYGRYMSLYGMALGSGGQ